MIGTQTFAILFSLLLCMFKIFHNKMFKDYSLDYFVQILYSIYKSMCGSTFSFFQFHLLTLHFHLLITCNFSCCNIGALINSIHSLRYYHIIDKETKSHRNDLLKSPSQQMGNGIGSPSSLTSRAYDKMPTWP